MKEDLGNLAGAGGQVAVAEAAALYAAYRKWWGEDGPGGERPLSNWRLGCEMGERFERMRPGPLAGKVCYAGLRLRPAWKPEDQVGPGLALSGKGSEG